jgi:hypothetical protein
MPPLESITPTTPNVVMHTAVWTRNRPTPPLLTTLAMRDYYHAHGDSIHAAISYLPLYRGF